MAQDFLLTYAPLANDIAQRTGLDPSVVLGIVDTETGGGTRVAGNNVFGISPVDKSGRQYVEKYPDVETAAEAFVTLMQTPRYRAIAAAGGPAQQAAALVKAGYNTVNPRYAEIVANKATRYGQILGYQDEGQGGQPGAAQPVAAAAAAPAPDYNNPPARSAAPVAPVVAAPAGTGSAVDRVLADPALSGAPAATPAPAAAGAKPQTAVDRVLADPALQAPATAAPAAPPAAPDKGGIARNVAAGVLEGVGGTGNALANPSGAIGQLPATAIVFLHDALAPVFGYERFPDKARNMLLGNELNAQPGTTAINALGAGINTVIPGGGSAIPSDVEAKTEAEKYARVGATGATMGAMMSPAAIPASLGAIMGAAGGAGATAAGEQVPEWMRPMTEIVAGGVAGAAALPVAMGARALQQGVNRFANGPAPGAAGPPLTQAQQVQRNVQIAMGRTPGSGEGGGGGMPPPGGEGPQPGMGPRSVGAAGTPTALAQLTEQQALEYGSVADKQWLYKSMPPGEAVTEEFVKGITPTMAQREQSVVRARETKAARNLSPEAAQAERELLDHHNTLRKDDFQEVAGSDVTQGVALRDASAAIDSELEAAFASGAQADPAAIMDAIQAERTTPGGKLPPVQAVLNSVEKAMQKLDGTGLETDPRQIWGVRRVINFLQSKHAIAETKSLGHPDVQASLERIKAVLDQTNEGVAPGFNKALANYAEAQRKIEANEVMQAAEKTLYDDKGRMQFSRFHKFMKDVITARDPRAGINPYKSLSPEQMGRLKSLHDDLMRVASAEDLARAAGSDTTPNLLDVVKQAAKGVTGTVVSGAIGHVVGGPAGALLSGVAQNRIASLFDKRAIRRAGEDMNQLLHPDPAKYPLKPNPFTNQLGPP
jgi:hypothetical protein